MANYGSFSKKIFNAAYEPFHISNKRYQHIMGGGGSGKSYDIALNILFRYMLPYQSMAHWEAAMLLKYPKHEFRSLVAQGRLRPPEIRPHKEKIVLLRSQQNLVRHSQFAEMKNIISKYNLAIDVNESNMTMRALNGNEIMCAGLRAGGAERLKSISGVTRFWVEEATDGGITLSDIDQLDTRLRVRAVRDSSIIMSYNPVHEAHWINQYYWKHLKVGTDTPLPQKAIDYMVRNSFFLRTTYKDNLFLPQEYVEQLEAKAETNPNYYKVYALGEWGGTPEGCIFTNWSTVDEFPDACDKFVYGVDKGMVHPYAIMKVSYLPKDITAQRYDEKGKPYTEVIAGWGIYAQEVAYERGLTSTELIGKYTSMSELEKERYNKDNLLNKEYQVFISPEAASDKKEWRNAGFDVADANNDVTNGISFIQNIPIYFVKKGRNKSMNAISEVTSYKYQMNKQTATYIDKPNKVGDDLMDALRYGAYTGFKAKKHGVISMFVMS